MTYQPVPTREAACEACARVFVTNKPNQITCSVDCKRARDRSGGYRSPLAGLVTKGSVGAAHEMLVAADLLKRGFDVYRSVSPTAHADIIIVNGSHILRVEVTTGTPNRRPSSRPLSWPPKVASRHDILAVVTHPGVIHYLPEPPTISPSG